MSDHWWQSGESLIYRVRRRLAAYLLVAAMVAEPGVSHSGGERL